MATQGLADAASLLIAERGGDQQQTTFAQCALIEQLKGLGDRKICAMARLRHDRRLESFKQVAAGGQVIGQRHQCVGTAGVDDHGGLRIGSVLQQVVDLAARLFQPVGRAVGGQHVRGQFQHDDQRVGGLLGGLFDPLPTGAQ